MKKKLLSILAVLVICLSPVLFMVGCSPSEDQGVTMTPLTGWTVAQNASFASMTVPSGFSITYKAEDRENPKYDDKGNIIGYNTKDMTITTLADAIANGLRVIEGFDSSTAGAKTMKVFFGGEIFTVSYTVTATTTGGNSGT